MKGVPWPRQHRRWPYAQLAVLALLAQFALLAAGAPSIRIANAQLVEPTPRWRLNGAGIRWQPTTVHSDELEMSGLQVSAVVRYGRDSTGALTLTRTIVWPMLRTVPNDTHGSLIRRFDLAVSPAVNIDGRSVDAQVLTQVDFDGQLLLTLRLAPGVTLQRLISPHPTEPALIERWTLRNDGPSSRALRIGALDSTEHTAPEKGVYGSYDIRARSPAVNRSLAVGEQMTVDLVFSARLPNEMVYVNAGAGLAARRAKLDVWRRDLVLETPDPRLDAMFAFAKIRATESLFATRGGVVHSPGGTRYYAAIWANDQAEYVNPFFPYLGDPLGIEAALTSYRWFAHYMNDAYRPLPSSVIAEGTDFWNGAGDRGDCAMIAYGASEFALALGDAAHARELWPLISWCLEYERRQLLPSGVVASTSDELEGRFPSGDANLSTNMLTYAALVRAARLRASLERADGGAGGAADGGAKAMADEADRLKAAIVRHFGARVSGFDTWRYYEGNDRLRAWIALPLAFGIDAHKAGTIDALLSDKLWTANGILTAEGDHTFWDRSTLYAFRALMKAGALGRVWPYFVYYSHRRLLGDHVPYAVEAWPEGQQRHLSAESGLYARVVTEGLFGIEPLGLSEFQLAPSLPAGWPRMALRRIHAFGGLFDIEAGRAAGGTHVRVTDRGRVVLDTLWDGLAPLRAKIPAGGTSPR